MQALKNIVTNIFIVLGLSLGLMISATALDDFDEMFQVQVLISRAQEAVITDEELLSFEGKKALAEQGNVWSQFYLGLMYYEGEGVSQDYGKAVKWFQRAANQGNVLSQYNLGVMYYEGEGVTQDYAQAVEWFQRAANQGDVWSQFYLGVLYSNGYGVRQSKVTAKEWFGKACDRRYQYGCDKYRELNEQGY